MIFAFALTAVVIVINPSLPLLTDELVPPGNPLPGSRFGGSSPLGTPASILSLLPSGLTPLAVFPPYSVPRTFGAESIIFAEDPEISQLGKRSIWNRIQRIPLVSRIWNRKRRIHLPFFSMIKNLASKFMKNFKCLQTRLYALGHPYEIQYLRSRTAYFPKYYDENINSIGDCIDGIQEPLYGFRTKVTLLKDSPCIMGSTCDSPSFSGKFCLCKFTNSDRTLSPFAQNVYKGLWGIN